MVVTLPPKGQGCCHCEHGVPVDFIEMRGKQKLALCLECVMKWFSHWTVTQWEARHTVYQDHVEVKVRRAMVKELKEAALARAAAG